MRLTFPRALGALAASLLVAVALVALVSKSEAAPRQKADAAQGAQPPEIVYRGGKYTNPSTKDIAGWLPSKPADYRIAYDDTAVSLAYGDLRLPKTKRPKAGYPVAVIIHGGGWTSDWGHDYIDPFAEALTRAGIATWNIEYRRPGNRGGGWPGTFLDVAHGTDFLRNLAPEFHLDLNRVVVTGQSAGGHLAVWVAGRHKIPKDSAIYTANPLPLRGVVSLDAWALDMRYDIEHKTDSAGEGTVLLSLLGVQTPEEAFARVDADGPSPTQLLPLGVPQKLFTGSKGSYPDANLRYANAAAAAGDSVRLTVLNGGTHFDPVDPCGPAWPFVVTALFAQLGEEVTTRDVRGPGRRLCREMHIISPP